ncbi:MAG: ATP-binding protein [Deltaproteobacteria bacterium]|nr:ATP-binding protein [Deltaproteobacteria bacterium]
MFDRWYGRRLAAALGKPFVHLVFGARQTGKSTLIRSLLPASSTIVDLSSPAERSQHLASPADFVRLCEALPAGRSVFVDEVQTVPSIFDAVQHLYDRDKRRLRFVLCGSSARKLRATGANLLPGRSFLHRLFPLTLVERPAPVPAGESARLPVELPTLPAMPQDARLFPAADLEERLAYGDLPGVVTAAAEDRAELLRAYATVYLEEEIRREALVKDWGAFVRFLRLAAAESGKLVNYAAVSREAGISQPTVKSHYQLLEDMFVGFRAQAYTNSVRKNLLSTPKFVFFDLGVRHAAAGLRPSADIVAVDPGSFIEQWVGIELWKRLQYLREGALHHLRTKDGAEIDWVVEHRGKIIPIEVKWTERPTAADARHLVTLCEEKPRQAPHGYVVCRCSRPLRLHERVTALPWWAL